MEYGKNNIKTIAFTGMMAALVLAGSMIEIRLGEMRFHLGNGLALLSGIFLGAVNGGLASGIGSLFFDLFFYPSTPVGYIITFISKFLMGFVAGGVFDLLERRNVNDWVCAAFGGLLGEAAYLAVYLGKHYITQVYVLGASKEAAAGIIWAKLISGSVNAVIAIIISGLLYQVLKPVFDRIGISHGSAMNDEKTSQLSAGNRLQTIEKKNTERGEND